MRHDFKCVPIPDQMRHLPTDRRGYPVPYLVQVDSDGRPHFTINDEVKRQRCISRDLCAICGNPNHRGRWFVGGPRSALHPRGAYVDPPLHAACARYALRVCPFLAVSGWRKRIDDQTLADKTMTVLVDPTMIPDQPQLFVAVMALGTIQVAGGVGGYLRPKRPFRQVEFWRDGQQIGEDWASAILQEMGVLDDPEVQGPKVYIPKIVKREART